MKLVKYLLTTAVAAMALGSMPSQAVLIGLSTNNPYNFGWSFDSGAAGLLTGTGIITAGGFNSSALTLNITLNNTSNPASDRLTSFGFGIDPNATGVTLVDASDGGMVDAAMRTQQGSTNIPSLTGIEVCAFGGNNCAGGSNGGISGGASDTFSLVLAGTWGNSVNIDPIGFKYQTSVGSFEFTTGGGGTPVPEPASIALLAIGLLGLSVGMRKRA